jgi:hypothetical protein
MATCRGYRSIIDAAPVDNDSPNVALHLRADGVAWSYEGFKTAWGRELDKPEMALFRERRWVFHGLRKNAVNMLLEVGCSEEQVAAIVAMSAAMVHHYSKEVSKFRLARRAMKMLESGGNRSVFTFWATGKSPARRLANPLLCFTFQPVRPDRLPTTIIETKRRTFLLIMGRGFEPLRAHQITTIFQLLM